MLLLFFSLFGWGLGMIEPMAFALVGTHYPLAHRARAIGWLMAVYILASIIGTLLLGFIGGLGGVESWRWAILGIMWPIALLSLGLTIKGIPSPRQSRPFQGSEAYWKGFSEIFANRSAIVCLLGNLLLFAGWQSILLYFITFLRERFLVSLGVATIIFSAGGLFYILGNLLGGRIIPRFGRKSVTVLAALLMGIFTMSVMSSHHLWLVVVLVYPLGFFSGMRQNAAYSLTLEQVPLFRGSMMSLNMAATSLGGAFGASLGGLTLLRWGFEGVGLSLGALCIVAAILYYLLAVDPAIEQAI
jgi:predicted MFS family arabinose efflux permease